MDNSGQVSVLSMTRTEWEKFNIFSKEQLDLAEKNADGFIGYSELCKGVKCFICRYIADEIK